MAFSAGAITGDLVLNATNFFNPLSLAMSWATTAANVIKDALGTGIKLAADYEQAEVAFTTMLGSAQDAKKLLGEISQFAAATPFKSAELISASQQLLAFGFSADEVTSTLKQLGDVTAGQGPNGNIGQLAYLFGTARVQGRLFQQDINQFTNRGIPIIGELAKVFSTSEQQVRKLVETGQVGFPQLQQAFSNLTAEGGRFHGMTEAQSHTLSGLWSTVSDSLDIALGGIGRKIIEAFDLKPKLQGIIDAMTAAGPAIMGGVGAAISLLKPALVATMPLLSGAWELLKGLGSFVNATIVPTMHALVPILNIISQTLGFVLGLIGKVMSGIGGLIGGMRNSRGLDTFTDLVAKDNQASASAAAAAGGGGSAVTIQNVNVGFDAREASSQVASKLHPIMQEQFERQGREFQGAAKQRLIAQRTGGRG